MKYVKFTKKALNSLKKEKEFSDRLSKRVINDLLGNAYTTSDLKYHMEDIAEFGCSGGNVMSLIYYSETERFFNCYRKEILNLFREFIYYNTGNIHEDVYEDNKGIYAIIYDSVIYEDQKKFTIQEKNNLTWFAYEKIVRRITQDYFKL